MYIRRSHNEAFQEYRIQNKPTSRRKRQSTSICSVFPKLSRPTVLHTERSGKTKTDYTDRRTYITADAQFKHIYT